MKSHFYPDAAHARRRLHGGLRCRPLRIYGQKQKQLRKHVQIASGGQDITCFLPLFFYHVLTCFYAIPRGRSIQLWGHWERDDNPFLVFWNSSRRWAHGIGKRPWAAIVADLGAHGGLYAGSDREGNSLGDLEEVVEVLTRNQFELWLLLDVEDRQRRPSSMASRTSRGMRGSDIGRSSSVWWMGKSETLINNDELATAPEATTRCPMASGSEGLVANGTHLRTERFPWSRWASVSAPPPAVESLASGRGITHVAWIC